MPLPIFYLEFLEEHGRDPCPDEIPLPERLVFRECAEENLRNGQHSAQEVEKLRSLAGDIVVDGGKR